MWSAPSDVSAFVSHSCSRLSIAVFLLAVLFSPMVCYSDEYSLSESVLDGGLHSVKTSLTVKGVLKTPQSGGKYSELPLDVSAEFDYLERRLSGTGRNARALRSLRYYRKIAAKISVQDRITSARLPDKHRLVVAQGEPEGVLFYHPSESLTYNELELLKTPADSLSVLSLLPSSKVKTGETWTTENWVIQFLTSTEAVDQGELICKLESVESGIAKVSLKGSLKGASLGSRTSITLSGYYLYDLNQRFIKKIYLTQSEKRPPQGAITPGMDLTATVEWERVPVSDSPLLPDKLASSVSLNPSPEQLRLRFQAPWKVRFNYDRNWHLFHQTDKAAVLRLLDKGNLIAQCNLAPLASMAPGTRLSEERFHKYIRESLGEKFKNVESSRVLPSDRNGNIYRYRVVASGRSDGRPMHWIYYLCADASGQQVAFVFSVETQLEKQLQDRDLQMVGSLEFVSSKQGTISSSRK